MTVSMDITPEMIDAGVYAMRECRLGAPLEDIALVVFVAMMTQYLASGVASGNMRVFWEACAVQAKDGGCSQKAEMAAGADVEGSPTPRN